MALRRHINLFLLFAFIGLAAVAGRAQAPPAAGDATAVWQALLAPVPDSAKAAQIENVVLQRDQVKITLVNGTVQIMQPAGGVAFAAIFRGEGRIQVTPPNPLEAQQLFLFTKHVSLDEPFTDATFSFTDKTLEELSSQVKWGSATSAADELYAKRQEDRENLGAELLPRLFKAVLSPNRERTAFFLADLHTKEYGWLQVLDDALQPEEISLGRWQGVSGGQVFDTWMSFPANGRSASAAFATPFAKADYVVRDYRIDATATGGAELESTTTVGLETKLAGERVLLFSLDSNLRLDKVSDAGGGSLTFFQARERKERNQSYGDYIAVTLPEPTPAGQKLALQFHYAGKHIIIKVGSGNYFARSFGWYPTRLTIETGEEVFAGRYGFEMTFKSPKRYGFIATGNKLSDTTDGDWRITKWKTDIPEAVAGFAFGDYKEYTEKVSDNLNVEVYANANPNDFMASIEQAASGALPGESASGIAPLGSLSPSALRKTIGIEMANAMRVFQKYYGPYPYKQLVVTNIPGSFGQGWPGLIYLSAFTFLDSTQRHTLGLPTDPRITEFFRAHETSHQWWGHRVGWKSYHDQWLSEGFAQFSGNLYVQIRDNQKEYINRLRKDREDLLTGDEHSIMYDSIGPIWMGTRLSSSRSLGAYSVLVYNKGGYVLNMLRMMLYDVRNPDPDHLFEAMMQDFCNTYDNKPASTEDFKAIVDKHMTPGMDADGNHRMDWFFNEYVYGTGIPRYEFHYQVQEEAGGKWKVTGEVTRTGVPDSWKDLLPLYVRRGKDVYRLGLVRASNPQTPFALPPLPFKPDAVELNINEAMLAQVKQ